MVVKEVDMEYKLQPIVSYMQELLDENQKQIKASQYQICVDLLQLFSGWYDLGNQTADDLYSMIDIKEDGEGIFEFAECVDYESEEIHNMWQILLSILMTMVAIAYQKEHAEYVPQDIEIINIQKIDSFFSRIEENTSNPKSLFDYFCKEVCD